MYKNDKKKNNPKKRSRTRKKKWLIAYDRYDTTIYISKINY